MQFTILAFFSFINICLKGEGANTYSHGVALLIFCLRDMFISPPFYLSVALTRLLLNSSHLSLLWQFTSASWYLKVFQLVFPTSCQLQNKVALSGGKGRILSASPFPLKLKHLRDNWTAFRFPYHPAFSSDGAYHEHTVLLMTSICCYGNSGGITDSAQWLYCRRNGQGFRENLIKTESCQFWTVER